MEIRKKLAVLACLPILALGLLAPAAAPALAQLGAPAAEMEFTEAEAFGNSGSAEAPDEATQVTPAFQKRVLDNPLGSRDMGVVDVVVRVIQLLTGLVGAAALLVFVYGSFLLLTSAGNDQRVKKGKDAMVWSVAGLAVIFAAYAVISMLFQGLGV